LLAQIRDAIAQADASTLQRAAHTLKGSVGNFGADNIRESARRLEQMGREGDLTHALETCQRLEHQISQLIPALQTLINDEAA